MNKQYVERFDLETEEHLTRYLAKRGERTGQKWKVVERYFTLGASWRDASWDRALIKAEDGSTLRIYHTGRYWQMGQKVLVSKVQEC